MAGGWSRKFTAVHFSFSAKEIILCVGSEITNIFFPKSKIRRKNLYALKIRIKKEEKKRNESEDKEDALRTHTKCKGSAEC